MSGCIVFFFSSRRRHTRYIGDWSSDVCSSDLELAEDAVEVVLLGAGALGVDAGEVLDDARRHRPQGAFVVSSQGVVKGLQRSEERRVGKEGGARWWR